MAVAWLRLILILLAALFAFGLGGAAARLQQGREKRSKVVTWALRTLAALAAVCWRGLDRMAWAGILLCLLAAILGAYVSRRPPQPDHLERVMFPKDREQ